MTITFMRAISIYPFKSTRATTTPDLATDSRRSEIARFLSGGILKLNRSAVSLLGFCVLTASGAALAFALIIAGGTAAFADHQDSSSQTSEDHDNIPPIAPLMESSPVAGIFNGMVTDSYCGARHRRASKNSSDCAHDCIRKGAHYVLVDGDHRYRLIGADDLLDRLVGQRATVTGSRQGGIISVIDASPVSLP